MMDEQDPNHKIADGIEDHGGDIADTDQHAPLTAEPEAERPEPLGEIEVAEPQPNISEVPVEEPHAILSTEPEAGQREPLGETAEAETQPATSEVPDEEPHSALSAEPEVEPLAPSGEPEEASQEETVDESANASSEGPGGPLPFTEQNYPFSAQPETGEQEPPVETPSEGWQPVAAEAAEAEPHYTFSAGLEAELHKPVSETAAGNWHPVAGGGADADPQEPAGVTLDPEQREFLAKLDAAHREPIGLTAGASPYVPAFEPPQAVATPPIVPPPPAEAPPLVEPPQPDQAPKPVSNTAIVLIMIGMIVGVLFGIAIAAITLHRPKPAPAPEASAAPEPAVSHETKDLGSVNASDVGVTGHLTTKWDGNLKYNLVIAPDDPARQAEFALMVSHPPRPLAVNLEMKNSYGFVLCSQSILLKYDPRQAAPSAASAKGQAAKGRAAKGAQVQQNQAAPVAPLDAKEVARENGKDIFNVQTGPDGQIASLSSQGLIPCPAEAYANFAYWSFTPDFPSLAEQDQWMQDKTGAPEPAAGVRKRAKKVVTEKPAYFSVAGDDAIVGYDPATGNIETGAGKIFLLDKTGAEARAISGRDFPVNFHYSCDQAAVCTLTHGGVVLAHARMKK